MSKVEKAGFYVGMWLVILARLSVYAILIYGIISGILNREIPYLAIIIFLLYQIWKSVVLFSSMSVSLSKIAAALSLQNIRIDVNKSDTEKLLKLINIVHLNGGSLDK